MPSYDTEPELYWAAAALVMAGLLIAALLWVLVAAARSGVQCDVIGWTSGGQAVYQCH